MSYSFSVVASDKKNIVSKIMSEYDKIVESQPIHSNDRDQAEANAVNLLNVLPEPSDEQEIVGSVSGYVSWQSEEKITSVNATASFSLRTKE